MKLSKWVPSPYAEFGIYRSCGSGNETFPICHMTLSDDMIKDHIALWVRVPHQKSPL